MDCFSRTKTLLLTIERDPVSGAYVGHLPTADAKGRPADERTVMTLSPDGKQLETQAYVRSEGSEDWLPTYRSATRVTETGHRLGQ